MSTNSWNKLRNYVQLLCNKVLSTEHKRCNDQRHQCKWDKLFTVFIVENADLVSFDFNSSALTVPLPCNCYQLLA